MQIIVCLSLGGHEISIKLIFDFRTSLPINEILYIRYINVKRKKSHRKKCHRIKSHQTSRKKITGKKVTRKKSHRKNSHNIFFPHLLYPRKVTVCIISDCPYPGYGVYRHFHFYSVIWWLSVFITIYFKFGFILINNNI